MVFAEKTGSVVLGPSSMFNRYSRTGRREPPVDPKAFSHQLKETRDLSGEALDSTPNTDGSALGVGTNHPNETGLTNDTMGINIPEADDYEANMTADTTSSTSTDNFTSFPPSSGSLPPTQIINRGGTININYHIYHAPGSGSGSGSDPAHKVVFGNDVDEGVKDDSLDSTSTPTRTHPIPTLDPTTFPGTMIGDSDQSMSAEQNRRITPSWAISEIEKAKLKDSVALIFMGDTSRVNLARAMAKLAKKIRTDKWDERLQCWTPMTVGYESSSTNIEESVGLVSPSSNNFEGMNTDEPVTKEQPLAQGSFEHTSFLSDETFQSGPSHPGKNAPSKDRSEPSQVEGNESDTTSTGTVVRSAKDQTSSKSHSTQGEGTLYLKVLKDMVLTSVEEIRRRPADNETGEPVSTQTGRQEGQMSKVAVRGQRNPKAVFDDAIGLSTTASPTSPKKKENSQYDKPALATATGPLHDSVKGPCKEVAFADITNEDETTNEAFSDASVNSESSSWKRQQKEKETCLDNNPTEPEPQGTPAKQSSTAAPVPTDVDRVLRSRTTKQIYNYMEPKDTMAGAKTKQQSNAGRKGKNPDAKTSNTQAGQTKNKGSKEIAQTSAAEQKKKKKVDKPRSKTPADEAHTCERDADAPASSSASDQAARANVLNILAQLAGRPAAAVPGAQGPRDLGFLLGSTSGPRKCRLCRNVFSDETNIRRADGGAPCSFHPGVLEDKDGKNVNYAFSCCGGPPVMVGPNLVAMNLVSPGCTKCYHQDKRSAWDLDTFKMKDPVLFEG